MKIYINRAKFISQCLFVALNLGKAEEETEIYRATASCGRSLGIECHKHKLLITNIRIYSGCEETASCLLESSPNSHLTSRSYCTRPISYVINECEGNSHCVINTDELSSLVQAEKASRIFRCDAKAGMQINLVVEYRCERRKNSLSNICHLAKNMPKTPTQTHSQHNNRRAKADEDTEEESGMKIKERHHSTSLLPIEEKLSTMLSTSTETAMRKSHHSEKPFHALSPNVPESVTTTTAATTGAYLPVDTLVKRWYMHAV